MTRKRQYLVGLTAWSYQVVWVTARSESDARDQALELWGKDDSRFSHKDSGVDDVSVLETSEVQP